MMSNETVIVRKDKLDEIRELIKDIKRRFEALSK